MNALPLMELNHWLIMGRIYGICYLLMSKVPSPWKIPKHWWENGRAQLAVVHYVTWSFRFWIYYINHCMYACVHGRCALVHERMSSCMSAHVCMCICVSFMWTRVCICCMYYFLFSFSIYRYCGLTTIIYMFYLIIMMIYLPIYIILRVCIYTCSILCSHFEFCYHEPF